ncbi:hypothetical protein F7725_013477 [Dissostichus mawsoni]|uniref:IGFBP N-terminal domain-containing protein n=1 Tax=Dissostichus mawsoni TaxID=36200 RepID=A0A7J5YQI8_DISMA|nr:hypothetical protein F7725_013477 [Dissostichus mawsoni]
MRPIRKEMEGTQDVLSTVSRSSREDRVEDLFTGTSPLPLVNTPPSRSGLPHLKAAFHYYCPRMLSAVTLQQIFSSLFVLGSAAVMADSGCPAQCSCPPLPQPCPAGISWVSDRCGCCKVCARQFNEDCSATQPCDHIKGLRCHLGAGGDPRGGCVERRPRVCPVSSGAGCTSMEKTSSPAASTSAPAWTGWWAACPSAPPGAAVYLALCATPAGQHGEGCCRSGCVTTTTTSMRSQRADTHLPARQPAAPNHISALLQAPLQPWHRAATGRAKFREMVSFPMSEVLPQSSCFPQTTEWTECSTTCGMGISSRVTNENQDCQLVRESRLCQVRQCEPQLPVASKKSHDVALKVALFLSSRREEVSTDYPPPGAGQNLLRWMLHDTPVSAPQLWDMQRWPLLHPSLSRTVRLRFHCPDVEGFYRNVMWIQRCSCTTSCGPYSAPSSPAVSVHNDIHTFSPSVSLHNHIHTFRR